MGVWSVSINGNDAAEDLISEYQVAFCYNDVETAVRKIDKFVRDEGYDESDSGEWCDYYYSLANYMWKKGILTNEVRDAAIKMIDSGFGLELYEEAGKSTLNQRKKVLTAFREKLLSPQPEKKKIKVNMYTKPIFEIGDIIAIQLQTANKHYITYEHNSNLDPCKVSEEEFRAMDGKYVLIKKISDNISYTSQIDPNIKDMWPVFRLYKKIFDDVPDMSIVSSLDYSELGHDGRFVCEGSMYYFKRRNCVVIGNDKTGIEDMQKNISDVKMECFSINDEIYNIDTAFINEAI